MTDHIYLNGATLMTTPTERVLAIARQAGYAGIEARAERLLRDKQEVRATAKVARAGEVLMLNGVDLTLHADGRLNSELLEADLKPRLEICQEIGAPFLIAIPPRAPGLGSQQAITGTREALERARDKAGAIGVRIAFEFLGFVDCPVNTPALASKTVEGIDGIALALDSCHWHASGGGSLSGYPVGRLALVHLNDAPPKAPEKLEDADRVLPGEGVIKFAQLIKELNAGSYSGPWSLETFNPAYWNEDPDSVAARGLAAIQRILR